MSLETNGAVAMKPAADAESDTTEVRDRFRKLMRNSLITGSRSGNPVLNAVAEHFGADPADLPTMMEPYQFHLVINRQAGVDAFLAEPGRESSTHGVVIATDHSWGRLADLLLPPSFPIPAPRFGQVGEKRKEAGYKKWIRCLTKALVLFRDEKGPGALWVTEYNLEAMAPTAERAAEILDEIRQLGIDHSPYRGECVTIKVIKGAIKPVFVKRPSGLTSDDVILPPGLLERVEEHVVGIAHHAEQLLARGRHLKRGILLWGRPGTGKTHTIRYLASQLPDHTVLILPGSDLAHLSRLSDMIEICAPGIVVLDDVDYIAEDRSMPSMGAASNLYELLETLDGMTPDADLLFVLTTNRADTIEPAVAARPGRVDQAMEIPPPDADCRQRLFALYSKGMHVDLDASEIASVVERTAGVTGSFFKELLRRCGMAAADAGHRIDGKLVVTAAAVDAAIAEMLDPANPLTQKMLGVDVDVHAPLGTDEAQPA